MSENRRGIFLLTLYLGHCSDGVYPVRRLSW